MMTRLATLAALVVILGAYGQADAQASNVTLSSLGAAKLQVNLTYNIDDELVPSPTPPCLEQAPGSKCLPVPHAARDEVLVKYSVLPQYTPNTTDTVTIKACYSNFSIVDRPWRAANDIIAKSKRCPFVIGTGLNATAGNATWKIPNTVPIATYYVQALVYAKNASNPSNPNAVAVGKSVGYFQVQPISDREKGLVIAASICICVGPILFTFLMLWEFKWSKKRV